MSDIVTIGEGMVEFIQGRGDFRSFGGDVSNFAITASRLGKDVEILTKVGADHFGDALLQLWKRERVRTGAVKRDPKRKTGSYTIRIGKDGGHEFEYDREGSAASSLVPEELDENRIKEAKVLHISGITQAISESCLKSTESAIKIAREAGIKVSYDPNIRLKLWDAEKARKTVLATLPLVDIFLPNEEELRLLGLESWSCELTAIKRGEKGCTFLSDGKKVDIEAFETEVVDTTGAGDAFDAAVVVGYLGGKDLEEIGSFANRVGAMVSSREGAYRGIPKQGEIV